MSHNAVSSPTGALAGVPVESLAFSAGTVWLRRFAKLLVVATLALIFFGGQVKSHEAGLSVPDWPLTYGHNPITFPLDQWVGGIFHEHFHRLLAGCVATGSVILAAWAFFVEKRAWVRNLALVSVAAVVAQAVLGGMTVWYQLPVLVSSSHAILAQSYLLINVILAYALSVERADRKVAIARGGVEHKTPLFLGSLLLIGVLYAQLMLGALTRHTESGLAIPDFPTTAGQWIPSFDEDMLNKINDLRAGRTDAVGTPLDPVLMHQVVLQFLHRLGALLVVAVIGLLAWLAGQHESSNPRLLPIAYLLCGTVLAQFVLGFTIVMTGRSPGVASLHVAVGAATLALAGLLALRAWPLRADNVR